MVIIINNSSADFVIQRTNVKNPEDRTINDLGFKKYIYQNVSFR